MKNKIDQSKIENYYNKLLEITRSSKKKKNLEIINAILYELYEMSSSNFSIAHIGKLSKKRGGPIAQTIRNQQGKDYRDFINYFINHITIIDTKIKKEYELSDYIEDPGLKAHVNLLIAENKSLSNQLNILKQNMSKNFILDYTNGNEKEACLNIKSLLSNTEIDALDRFVKNLDTNSSPLKITPSGSLKDENGLLIANTGFFDAIKKILDFSQK